jgi:hypothetical protein
MDIVESDSETNAIALQYLIQIKTTNNVITFTHSLSVTRATAPHRSSYPTSMQIMSYSYVHYAPQINLLYRHYVQIHIFLSPPFYIYMFNSQTNARSLGAKAHLFTD